MTTVKSMQTRKNKSIISTTVILLLVIVFVVFAFDDNEFEFLSKSEEFNKGASEKNNMKVNGLNYVSNKNMLSENDGKYKVINVINRPSNFPDDDYNPLRNFIEIVNTAPMVLFVRSTEHNSIALKQFLLRSYEISPAVLTVDLDKHKEGNILENFIKFNKLADSSIPPPYLFINGASVIDKNVKEDIIDPHMNDILIEKLKKFANGNIFFQKIKRPSNN